MLGSSATSDATAGEGKPKRAFEAMTIHKQYAEYHDLKDDMYTQLRSVNKYSTLLILIGVLYLVYLTISIFVENIREPLPLVLSHLIYFRGYSSDDVTHVNTAWMTAAFKFTGFLCAICFLMLGTYISYYKSVVKVDAMIQVTKAAGLFLTCFLFVGAAHFAFVTVFSIKQDLIYEGNQSLEKLSKGTAIILQFICYLLELLAFVVPYRQAKKTLAIMIQFHDYLIQYRLTPRSRILRKHLPKMATVFEEESNCE